MALLESLSKLSLVQSSMYQNQFQQKILNPALSSVATTLKSLEFRIVSFNEELARLG